MFKAIIDSNTYVSILETKHAKELFNLIDANRESIGKWLAFPAYTTEVQHTEMFIKKSLNRFASSNGYCLGKDFEGFGLATKACEVFTDLHLNKVEINMATTNTKSKAIPERLGFKEEGRIRNHEFLHGEYHDITTFGVLKDEWIHR